VEFIDSSGLGALVSALKQLRRRSQSDIRLTSVKPAVQAVLEKSSGLHKVFSRYPSVSDAVQSYGQPV